MIASDALCPCGSAHTFAACCQPVLADPSTAPTAEALMRSRYAAFVVGQVDHLKETLAPEARGDYDQEATQQWADSAEWQGLTIHATEAGQAGDEAGMVEFTAAFRIKGQDITHHERSTFRRQDGRWYYVDGKTVPRTVRHEGPKVGRNDPCPCGSGKKFKKCCGGAG